MVLAGVMVIVLARTEVHAHRRTLLALLIGISVIDVAFFCSNSLRVFDGGSDGSISTAGNTQFATQGLFIP